jgi:hypothetical protein
LAFITYLPGTFVYPTLQTVPKVVGEKLDPAEPGKIEPAHVADVKPRTRRKPVELITQSLKASADLIAFPKASKTSPFELYVNAIAFTGQAQSPGCE